MPRIVNKYRATCTTENTSVYVWGTEPPTTCPNNIAHTIDSSSITIVDSVNDTTVQISQDKGLTGGNFRSETCKLIAKPNGIQSFDFSWPFDMSVSTVHFVTNAQHIGDEITSIIAPNTIVGYITAPVSIGDTIINVSPTVLQYVFIGYIVKLYDGINMSHMGYVLSKDIVNGTITLQTPSTHEFSPISPTYVMLEISNIHSFEIGDPNKYDIGQSVIGSGLIPANTVIRIQYKNKSKTDAKSFIFYFEYFY
jgi:hypothetical protein